MTNGFFRKAYSQFFKRKMNSLHCFVLIESFANMVLNKQFNHFNKILILIISVLSNFSIFNIESKMDYHIKIEKNI